MGVPCLSAGSLGDFIRGTQTASAQGYPAQAALDGKGGMLNIGQKAGLGPPLGVAHVIPGVSYLATQLTLGHIFPLKVPLSK